MFSLIVWKMPIGQLIFKVQTSRDSYVDLEQSILQLSVCPNSYDSLLSLGMTKVVNVIILVSAEQPCPQSCIGHFTVEVILLNRE